jgi:hypothetical protein
MALSYITNEQLNQLLIESKAAGEISPALWSAFDLMIEHAFVRKVWRLTKLHEMCRERARQNIERFWLRYDPVKAAGRPLYFFFHIIQTAFHVALREYQKPKVDYLAAIREVVG